MNRQDRDIEDYGVIGNLETCALVASDGSIDWLCLPYLESPSVFGALLDAEKGGRFRVGPAGESVSRRAYDGPTNVLMTSFETPSGSAVLTDFMPVKGITPPDRVRTLFRKLACTAGEVEAEVLFDPRPGYASAAAAVEKIHGGIECRWGGERVYFNSPVHLEVGRDGARGRFRLRQGEIAWFSLGYGERPPAGTRAAGSCSTRSSDSGSPGRTGAAAKPAWSRNPGTTWWSVPDWC